MDGVERGHQHRRRSAARSLSHEEIEGQHGQGAENGVGANLQLERIAGQRVEEQQIKRVDDRVRVGAVSPEVKHVSLDSMARESQAEGERENEYHERGPILAARRTVSEVTADREP